MRMTRTILKVTLVLVAASALGLGRDVEAQAGRGRGGSVKTPFGELYNTNSAEFRASGGNIFLMQELQQQKMMQQQQQLWLKQQAQMAKLKNGKTGVTSLPGNTFGQNANGFSTRIAPPRQKKRKANVTNPTKTARAAAAAKREAPVGKTAKPS